LLRGGRLLEILTNIPGMNTSILVRGIFVRTNKLEFVPGIFVSKG
jgi:hypothetical protein